MRQIGFTEPASAPQPPGQMAAEPRSGPDPAPYYGGAISPIQAHGDADPGGRDIASDSVPVSMTAATGRLGELESDITGAAGGVLGDLMDLPVVDSAANPPLWGPYPPSQPPSGSFT